jgi:hypothetical protein
MSFNDQEFDEVRDDRESKSFRIVKRSFKILLYGASALVWILIFVVIFATRESDLLEDMIFTSETQKIANDTKDYQVDQIIVSDFQNDRSDKIIKISSNACYYSRETGELEMGIQYNKQLTDSDTTDSIEFVLQDQDGNVYPVLQIEEDVIGRFGYVRVCFGGICIPTEKKNNKEVLNFQNIKLTLTLYRKSDGELLSTYTKKEGNETIVVNDSSFIIIDNKTVSRRVDFED